MKAAVIVVLVAAVVALASARQTPPFHYGCPPGKNACVYPLNATEFVPDSIFDFEVEVHVPHGKPLSTSDIKSVTIEHDGNSYSAVEWFGAENVKPTVRSWNSTAADTVGALLDALAEPGSGGTVYDVVALKWDNVKHKPGLYGTVTATVDALGESTSVQWVLREPTQRRAKNVILMIGDGMALNIVTATRLVSRGMTLGRFNDPLYMQTLPEFGLIHTSGTDAIMTDSANSASAYNTGGKSSVNAIGVQVDSNQSTNDTVLLEHPKLELLAEHVKRQYGMSVGVVTTAELQDATPAAVYSHTRQRDLKAEILSQALHGCPSCLSAVAPDVMLGGGGEYFLPADSVDGSNMYENFTKNGYSLALTKSELQALAASNDTAKLLGVFTANNLNWWLDRNVYTDNLDDPSLSPRPGAVKDARQQPGLVDMSTAALQVLGRNNDKGFYLMIEGAAIDKAAHPLDNERMYADTIEFDETVKVVLDWIVENGNDTLLLVTADHGHAYDTYGTVDTKVWKDADAGCPPDADLANYQGNVKCAVTYDLLKDKSTGSPIRELSLALRTSVGVYADAGYPDYVDRDGDHFPDSWDVRTTLAGGFVDYPDNYQNYRVSDVPNEPAVCDESTGICVANPDNKPDGLFRPGNLRADSDSGVHSLTDVGLFAYGPASDTVQNFQDNTQLYFIMAEALGVGGDGSYAPTPLPKGYTHCVNDASACHCAEVDARAALGGLSSAFAARGPLEPRGEGLCAEAAAREEAATTLRQHACLCAGEATRDAHALVREGTSLCAKLSQRAVHYVATGERRELDGLVPCERVLVDALERV